MCFSGKCNFERFDGDCDLYMNHPEIVKIFNESHLDYCSYGQKDSNDFNLTKEDKTIKFYLALFNMNTSK